MAKKQKYPLCEYCNKHHDTRRICPEKINLDKPKCPYCHNHHDHRLTCREHIAAQMKQGKFKKIKTDQNKIPKIKSENCIYYIELENGKYTVYIEKGSNNFKALRYGEPWRDLCGDNLIYFLMVDLIEATKQVQTKDKTIKLLEGELLKEEWEREI